MITVQCAWCKKAIIVNCTDEQIQQWQRGKLIQDAMPNVPKEERELLISRTCNACFQGMWKEEV